IQHSFGIPHSPTDQAIVERAHSTLKTLLLKKKGGEEGMSIPHERLSKAIFVLNFLRYPSERSEPPVVTHVRSMQNRLLPWDSLDQLPSVRYRDPQT
ncbi:POK19 protein, partial [Crypturellus soui]|nr:POK19 protein [Crypturellus soui]